MLIKEERGIHAYFIQILHMNSGGVASAQQNPVKLGAPYLRSLMYPGLKIEYLWFSKTPLPFKPDFLKIILYYCVVALLLATAALIIYGL